MTLQQLYEKLKADAREKGSPSGQVWHEADLEGHHLYMADTSFGDGPIFRFDRKAWYVIGPPDGAPVPATTETDMLDLERAMLFAERAEWKYRLKLLDQNA